MPPKPKIKCRRREGAALADDLFHYNNQVELTFKNQPAPKLFRQSSSSDDDDVPFPKTEVKTNSIDSSSSSEEVSEDDPETSNTRVEEEDKAAEEVTTIADRPVTPPPALQIPGKFSARGLQLSRDVGNKLKSLQELTKQDQSPHSATGWSDVVLLDQVTPGSAERKFTLRVRTKKGLERFRISMNDKFDVIISQLAKKQGVPVETVSLSFTDRQGSFTTLKGSDSPMSVNLSCADIIDCIIVNSAPSHGCPDDEDADNVVNIKIQGSQANSTKLFKAFKDEPLGDIMRQYADFRQLPLSKIKFYFDGDAISSNQTPDDLDMDEENVVDVRDT